MLVFFLVFVESLDAFHLALLKVKARFAGVVVTTCQCAATRHLVTWQHKQTIEISAKPVEELVHFQISRINIRELEMQVKKME